MIELPADVRSQFDGHDLAGKTAVAAMLSTVDGDEWPHLSFLSAGEVLIDGDRVALSLWGAAHSTRALEARRRGVLFAAAGGVVHEVRLEVAEVRRPEGASLATVLGRADALREHKAPYARVEGLIGFTLDDPAGTVARWERQVADLRAALATLPDVAVG